MPSETIGLCAHLFPGQGSQTPGMGLDLYRAEAAARALWDEADELLGIRLSKLAFEGPEEVLRRTENAQPALLVSSVAALKVHSDRGSIPPADYVAGHSLGEFTALVAAGALTFADAVRLVRLRGELMGAQGEQVGGAMSAVIGLETGRLAELCDLEGVDVANYNSPEQSVISGGVEPVARAGETAKAAGARRVLPLPVSGAFHSRLMLPIVPGFEPAVAATPLREPLMPVIGNVRALPLGSVDEIRQELVEQLYSPVRWLQSLQWMWETGVRTYVEVGTGKVLTGLTKRTLTGVTLLATDSLPANAGARTGVAR